MNVRSYIHATGVLSMPDTEPRLRTSAPGDDDETCDLHVVHEDAVREAREGRADPDDLAHLADTFQILASPTRLRIVDALARRELCVCDLAAVVGASPSAVSHHLRQLRQMKIVRYRREGRMAYYRLDDEHIASLFGIGMEHVRE
jgi:ArsR family transcriptional regulator